MSTQSVLEYASRKIGGVPRLPPVVGGSGRRYWTIADALAGESAQAVTVAGIVPQAGTQAGVVVFQAGQSAVNNFYKNQYVLDTDTTPTNGLVAQWARISDYIGPSRTATLDKSLDFSAESSVDVIQPARIALEEDVTEDVLVTIPVEIDLQGHKITGKIDVTAGQFCWIRGGLGYVTNGIQKTDYGLLKVDDCAVSRRDATLYALLLTSDSNLGRCEISKCEFFGRVAARRGFMGWGIYYCKNEGIPNSAGDNLPYTLVESPSGGAAVVVSALDISIFSEFGGAVLYSENSITGPAAYIVLQATLSQAAAVALKNPFPVSFARASGAATLTCTPLASGYLTFISHGANPPSSAMKPTIQIFSALNFTGVASIDLSATGFLVDAVGHDVIGVTIEGASDMTGSITISGGATFTADPSTDFFLVNLESRMNGGSIIYSATTTLTGGIPSFIRFDANQNAGAPVLTISGQIIGRDMELQGAITDFVGATAVSVGTWTVSGNLFLDAKGNNLVTVTSGFSGGTINVSSSTIYVIFKNAGVSPSFVLLDFAGTGGTCTISGTLHVQAEHYPSFSRIAQATGTGGTATVSGAVTVYGMSCQLESNVVLATGNGATAVVSGAITYFSCRFESDFNFVRTTNAGAAVTGPSSLTFEHCTIIGGPQTVVGAGTNTWTNATLVYRHCYIGDIFTLFGPAYTSVEAFHTRFNGNSGNKSITASGTRPATYRLWKCSYAARYDDIQPEVLDVYDVLPAQAALVRGQPVFVNTANQYQVCVASSIVDGVSLDAPAGAGSRTIAVRQGRVYVSAKAGTVNGDNLALDIATPTQCYTSPFLPGQNVGTALENVGATIAGKCYAAVNLR